MSNTITEVTSDPKLVGYEGDNYPGTLDALVRQDNRIFRISFIEFRKAAMLSAEDYPKYVIQQIQDFLKLDPVTGCECGCNNTEKEDK